MEICSGPSDREGQLAIPVLTAAGVAAVVYIDLIATGAASNLPYAPARYFDIDETTILIPMDKLLFSRARPEGIAHASILMRDAFSGKHTKRRPISVQITVDDRFFVLDGNSTALNGLASGWPDIPCQVVDARDRERACR